MRRFISVLSLALPLSISSFAAPVAVGIGAFGAPAVTFTGIASGTALQGLSVGGFTFSETFAGTTQITSTASGPGDTNNLSGQAAVTQTNPAGEVVTISLAQDATSFGLGFAVLGGPFVGTLSIAIYDGATSLGSLAFDAAVDPFFLGGFAGLSNDTAFDRVELVFAPSAAAFAFDNIRFNAASVTAVPEPGSLALLGLGLAGLASTRRRKQV